MNWSSAPICFMFHVPDWLSRSYVTRLLYALMYSMACAANVFKYSMARMVFNGSFTESFMKFIYVDARMKLLLQVSRFLEIRQFQVS